MNILEEIAVKTRERIAQEKRQVPQEVLLEKIKERESLEQEKRNDRCGRFWRHCRSRACLISAR